jgi:sugar/nucleoside kinase (ribokinase family)
MPDRHTREQVCTQTSANLAAAAGDLSKLRAVVGLDGFVDEIIAVVDKRHSHESYDSVPTIEHFGGKIRQAIGQSSNYELIVKQMKLGGSGPIMGNALASLGMGVTYIGAVGYPHIHPVFQDFARRAKLIGISEPAHTDALEFADGKLMLGKLSPLSEVTWPNLLARVGREPLMQMIGASQLIGMVNWTMLPHMSRIWERLLEEVFPALPESARRRRTLFVDLNDPEKRTHADIVEAMKLLTRFQQHVDVILGVNLKESSEVADVLGISLPGDAESAIEQTARAIRQKLQIACVVIHPRRGAAAATAEESAIFPGPFVQEPKISTGAGDHFNAGFCLGRVLGFSLGQSLCTGVATSGYYVRTAYSPTAIHLAEFVAQLPPPECK